MIRLDDRLGSVAELVGNCKLAADIGSDHGYLAIYLVQSGQAEKAIAADINRGPLEASKRNIMKENLEDRIVTRLSNGLANICDLRPDSVIIAGMGGELIYDIISNAPCDYCRWQKPSLILQPMSSVYELCCILANEGFEIEDERLSFSSGKLYRAMRVKYSGVKQDLSLLELHIGRANLQRGGELLEIMLAKIKNKYERIIKGKRASLDNNQLLDIGFELEVLDQIERYRRGEIEYK